MICGTRPRNRPMLALLLVIAALHASPAFAQHAKRLIIIDRKLFQKWLEEDVRWIITDQERADFDKLTDDTQRDQFVETFWERRNPTPGSPENAFKDEHYRRIAYTNQHFTAGIPGWKTDRGRFYIMYGPPDKIVRHQRSDRPWPDTTQTGNSDSEEWHWAYIEGLGCDIILEFVDTCGCGEYHLPIEDKATQRKLMPVRPRDVSPMCLVDKILFP